MEQIEEFNIIGIAVQTTNENNQAGIDLGQLWDRFFSENVSEKISNKLSNDIYSIYTEYETDYTGKYTSILGHKVSSLGNIPDGMIGKTFETSNYKKITAKGEMPRAIVTTWLDIWARDKELKRAYKQDFEIHGAKSQQGENSEVEIYLSI